MSDQAYAREGALNLQYGVEDPIKPGAALHSLEKIIIILYKFFKKL